MSEFDLWDADNATQSAPAVRARQASHQLQSAVQAVAGTYGKFLFAATGLDDFDDRWHLSKKDIRKTVEAAGLFPNTGSMRRVQAALKRAYKDTGRHQRRTADNTHPEMDLDQTFVAREDVDLIPKDDWEGYKDSVSQGAEEKADRNFGEGGDSGKDRHASMAVTVYADWARSNGLRVASFNSLALYAEVGVPEDEQRIIAQFIQAADEDDDDKDDDGPDITVEVDSDDSDDDDDSDEGDEDSADDESDDDDSDDDESDDTVDADESDDEETKDKPAFLTASYWGFTAASDDDQDDAPPSDDAPPADDAPAGPPADDAGPPAPDAGADPTAPPAPDAGLPPAAEGAPPAPPAGPAPTENQPAEDALLDTALQSVQQMMDRETQEYQQIMGPLSEALQAIDYAAQVEQANNPLDVTPPEGTVDATPGAAAPEPEVPEQQEPAAPPQAPPFQPKAAREAAFRIAKTFDMPSSVYERVVTAMSTADYREVTRAVASLPQAPRQRVASALVELYSRTNPTFSAHRFYLAAKVDPRPFVGSSTREGGDKKHWSDSDTSQQSGTWAPKDKGEDRPNGKDAFGNPKDDEKDSEKPKAVKKKSGGVVDDWEHWSQGRSGKGLNLGGDAEIDEFLNDKSGYGSRASEILHREKGVAPHPHEAKTAGFFDMPSSARKVAGWDWDGRLNGYVAKTARLFQCSCGEPIQTPSYTNCRCGKIWNSYAVGNGGDGHTASVDMFICREIPQRAGVVMANHKTAGECDFCGDPNHDWTVHPEAHADVANWQREQHREEFPFGDHRESSRRTACDGHDCNCEKRDEDHGLEHAKDIEWVTDADREHADAPHAPGKTAAASPDWIANGDGQWDLHHPSGAGSGHVEVDGDAGAAWHLLNHEGDMVDFGRSPHPDHAMDEVEKRMLHAGLLRESDWTVYDDEAPQENRSIPSTEVKSPPSDWARRGGDGKWSPPAIPARPAS
ncbi:hypothetical protein SEA_SKOG_149 [Gordonia phage Skog]|uniref:Uncharacterized protein n=1 Tax=Gordonia phage Skog TaxID=2704033 RepID=A0A6G6XJL5_9CAUD|nr:methyltransferase [Gordonia phage Skog]QIG58301.1 hypothetical protein SEA_SKOG_149 [Gordonia phage Skog]